MAHLAAHAPAYTIRRPHLTVVREQPAEYDTSAVDTAESVDELDALEDLGDEIARLAAHIHAATYRLLVMIAEFEGGWTVDWWGTASPVFFDPRGGTHFEGRWKPITLPPDAVEALERENRQHGVEPDRQTRGSAMEVPGGRPRRGLLPRDGSARVDPPTVLPLRVPGLGEGVRPTPCPAGM
jgi:hypothetical protein